MLALRALGIGAGDEVIVPTNSFIATAEAVSLAGATPKLVDVDPQTHLITADAVAEAIGPRTRAVIPVHLMGSTVDLDPILEVARAARDPRRSRTRAQAHGAWYHGPARRLDRRLRLLLVLPDQEPRRLGRRRRGRDRRRRRSPSRSGSCAPTASGRATTTGWSARRRASTRCRPRCCGSSCGGSTAGTTTAAASARRCATASRARASSCPTPASADGDHVYHLFIVRTQAARRAARHSSTSAASRPRSTTRSRSTAPRRTRTSVSAQGSLPVAERLAEEICTLPLFPSMSDDGGRAGHRAQSTTSTRRRHERPQASGRAVGSCRRAADPRRRSGSPWSATATGARTSSATSSSARSSSSPRSASATRRAPRRSRSACPGVPVYDDLDEVLADPTIDAVLVATPPQDALRAGAAPRSTAGKHVLVEKPLAKTRGRGRRPDRARRRARPRAHARATRSSTARRSTRSAS